MHEEFEKKYGADWLAKVAIQLDGEGGTTDEPTAAFTVKIGSDEYHILTEALMGDMEAVGLLNTTGPKKYPENGQNHFGIVEVEEYPAHPRPKEDNKPMPRTDNFGVGIDGAIREF